MFRLTLDPKTPLTGAQITKLVSLHAPDRSRIIRLRDYYCGKNAILSRSLPADKLNNRIAHNIAQYIVRMSTGFFMGNGGRYIINDEKLAEIFWQTTDAEYMRDATFAAATEAAVTGVAFEILYIDEDARIMGFIPSAEDMIPIYGENVSEFLEGAIRLWTRDDYFTGKKTEFAELYTKSEIITYRREPGEPEYKQTTRAPHGFGDVPVIIYRNNSLQKGDFEDVISIIDAYDKAQSDSANDFEYFANAYLTITGAGGGLEDALSANTGSAGDDGTVPAVTANPAATLRQNRILFLDEKGQAAWLTKNINDSAIENYKNRLHRDIFFLSQVPALTDENFAGSASGVAIKYKLLGLEQLAMVKENKFRSATRKKLKFIVNRINAMNGEIFDPELTDIEFVFDRTIISNLNEIVDNVRKLEGIVSKPTQLSLLPFVKDVAAETQALKQEKNLLDEFA